MLDGNIVKEIRKKKNIVAVKLRILIQLLPFLRIKTSTAHLRAKQLQNSALLKAVFIIILNPKMKL